MLVNSCKAALLAAILALTGNVVWAQTLENACSKSCKPCDSINCASHDCCAAENCCKQAKCADGCNHTECSKAKTCSCCTDVTCHVAADKKCECSQGKKCCCDKKCECDKEKSGCCCAGNTHKIIVFVPMPMLGGMHAAPVGMLPPPMMAPPAVAPVMPPQTVGLPVPPPPPPGCYSYACPAAGAPVCCPGTPVNAYQPIGAPMSVEVAPVLSKHSCPVEDCLSQLGAVCEMCCTRSCPMCSLCLGVAEMLAELSETCSAKPQPSIPCCTVPCEKLLPPPMPEAECYSNRAPACACSANICAAATPAACTTCTPKTESKLCIIAKTDSDKLEMSMGDDACVSCKKATIKVADGEIILSRFEDRVRVRGTELKATADCVRTDRKNRLILEGDVLLHYKKDGHSANVSGECIELNLATGAMTVKAAVK